MKILTENMKRRLSFLKPILPFGVMESWDSLDPRLYHAVHVYWLKFYGMWFNNSSVYDVTFWVQVLYTLLVLFLVCFLPGVGEVVYLLKRKENIGDVAEGLYLFLSEMYTYFKVTVFWLNKDKVINLLRYLSCEEFKPAEAEHRAIIQKSIKAARFVMTYYSTMCVGAVSGKYYRLLMISSVSDVRRIINLLRYLSCEEFKPAEAEHRAIIRKSIKATRFVMTCYSTMCVGAVSVGIIMPLTENFNILPTNVEYPFFDVYKSPAYETLYIHHIYYKPATCIIDGAMDTILAAFVCSAIGQIEILSFNLRNFDKVAERRRKRAIANHDVTGDLSKEWHMRDVLKDCIRHHNSIIKYVSMIESAFSLASALQFMLSVMVLCLVGIQFLSIENPASHPMQIMWMAIYLTCMLTEVFILCWFGDELIWKSTALRQAAFDGPWLGTDQKTTIFIIIFLERCKKPLKVTAGKIFILSLDTYTVLINWAYKAFAVVSNMKK